MKNCWFVVLSGQYSRHCCSMWVDWALSWLVRIQKKIKLVLQHFCLWNAAKMSGECSNCYSIFCYISCYWSSRICQFFLTVNCEYFLGTVKRTFRSFLAFNFLLYNIIVSSRKSSGVEHFCWKMSVRCEIIHNRVSLWWLDAFLYTSVMV